MERPYQVVVWGATGFVGKLVCEHIARDYQGKSTFRWAMVARNKARLEGVHAEMVKLNPKMKDVPMLTADTNDQDAVDAAIKQTQVVVACAGPFAKIGTPVVDACVRMGSHYVDITGEIPWVARLIETYHDKAAEKGVKIVPCCGFDSIPSDMGTFLVASHIKDKLRRQTKEVTNLVGDAKGGVSGGTIVSLVGAAFDETPEHRRAAADPYGLLPPGAPRGPDKPDYWGVGYNKLVGKWHAPFIMQIVNSRVVRRSNYFNHYGDNFSYQEVMESPGPIMAGLATLALALGFGALRFLRGLMLYLLPKPGEGPSKEMQVTGFWGARVIGVPESAAGEPAPAPVIAQLGDRRDPGYWSTARMVLEAGLTLALNEGELKATGRQPGGVLTAASALGMPLVQRLRNAGFTFEIKE